MPVQADITEWQRLEYEKAFELYCYYMAFKLHFTRENFNYAEYGPLTSYKFETFYAQTGKRKSFAKLARRFDTTRTDVIENYMISNFVHNPKVWVNGLLTRQAQANYDDWRKLYENFQYHFMEECKNTLFPTIKASGCKSFMEYFRPVGGNVHTRFMNDITTRHYPVWFLVALHKVTGFIKTYDMVYVGDIYWQESSFLIRKTDDVVEDRDTTTLKQLLKEAIIAQGL